MSVQDYITKLQMSGWFDDIPSQHHAILQQEVQRRFEEDRLDTFLALSPFGFDAYECIYEPPPGDLSYYGILHLFEKYSNGQFCPPQIEEYTIEEQPYPTQTFVAFGHQNKRYECVVQCGKSFDFAVLHMINRALQDNGVKQQFIALPTVDQCAEMVFVSPMTYKAAHDHGLIPPPLYFAMAPGALDTYLEEYYAQKM